MSYSSGLIAPTFGFWTRGGRSLAGRRSFLNLDSPPSTHQETSTSSVFWSSQIAPLPSAGGGMLSVVTSPRMTPPPALVAPAEQTISLPSGDQVPAGFELRPGMLRSAEPSELATNRPAPG